MNDLNNIANGYDFKCEGILFQRIICFNLKLHFII